MPELAEVFYYAKQWSAGEGKPVLRVELHGKARVFRACDVAGLEEGLVGAKLKHWHTHGKQMLFEFTGGHWLWVHLGMTGHLHAPAQPFEAGKHDHLVLHQRTHALVFRDPRMFGGVKYYHSEEAPETWRSLPPQVQDKDYKVETLKTSLTRHPRTPLKTLLLDQKIFPGIGNWMADEVMWQMKLLPQTPAGTLKAPQVRTLHKTLQKIVKVSLETVGDDFSDPPKSWLFSHRWGKGHFCPRCGTDLVREDLRGRTTCWCPKCQH